MEEIWRNLQATLGGFLPNLLAALAVLIVGWLIALALSALTRRLLQRTSLDDRLANLLRQDRTVDTQRIKPENWIATAVFWLVILFTLVAFFQVLDLAIISQPLNQFLAEVISFIPSLLAALLLLFIAWLVATILRAIVVRLMAASGFSQRLMDQAEMDVDARQRTSIGQTIGNVVYWLVFLLFLPAILDALELGGILAPVQQLVDEILGFLPNLLAAALILLVGWLVARILRQVTTGLLASVGVDRLGERGGAAGALGGVQLSRAIGMIVYVLVLIPVAIAALNALNIPAVSEPAAAMLTDLLVALPAIFGAFLLIAIAYFVGRIVGAFVANLLANLGFDQLFSRLGLFRSPPTSPAAAGEPGETARRTTPSEIAGYLTTIAIILFAVMEGAELLGFEFLALLVADFLAFAGQVILGLIVFGLGLYLASLADRVIRDSDMANANILATAARAAIIIFSAALALRQMGIAESIVNLAFGLLLGAVAVAAALAFGLGGREVAGRQLERWQQELRRRSNREAPGAGSSPSTPDLPGGGQPEI